MEVIWVKQALIRLAILLLRDENARRAAIYLIIGSAVAFLTIPILFISLVLQPLEPISALLIGDNAALELEAAAALQDQYGYIQYPSQGNIAHEALQDLAESYPYPFDPLEIWGSPTAAGWQTYRVSSEFGRRVDPLTGAAGAMHNGLDLAVGTGTPVTAARSGVVIRVAYSDIGYGVQLAISHGGGWVTLYAHLSRIYVREGDLVAQGDIVAASGNTGKSTGPHLHYEVIHNGIPQNPRGFLP
jgi:murein DD-endopeptidase MepM/ murein hydrolase activator NlpD